MVLSFDSVFAILDHDRGTPENNNEQISPFKRSLASVRADPRRPRRFRGRRRFSQSKFVRTPLFLKNLRLKFLLTSTSLLLRLRIWKLVRIAPFVRKWRVLPCWLPLFVPNDVLFVMLARNTSRIPALSLLLLSATHPHCRPPDELHYGAVIIMVSLVNCSAPSLYWSTLSVRSGSF